MESTSEKRGAANWVTATVALLLILVALVHGARWRIEIGAKLGLPTVHVTGADILIWVAFIIWLAHCIRSRHLRAFCEVPFAVCLLLGWVILSAIPALKGSNSGITVAKAAALREFIKLFEIFVAAYLLYAVFSHRGWMLRAVILALFVGASASVLWACYQYARTERAAMWVSGAFSNRNTLAAYLALILPLLFGYALWSRRLLWRAWVGLLILASLFVVSAGGQFAAMVIGLIVVAFLFRRRLALSLGIFVILLVALVFPHMPRNNSRLLFESVALYRAEDLAGALKGALEKAQTESKSRIENLDKINTIMTSAPVETPMRQTPLELPGAHNYSWPWQQRYQEWQAAGNMIVASPLFGVGAGSYQDNVNRFYQYEYGIKLPPKYAGVNLREDDALSMYSVWGSSVGLPALLFMLLIVLHFFVRAVKGFRNPEPDWRGLSAGGIGALVALCIAGVFTDYLVGGVGITLAITLGLIAASALRAREAAQSTPSEGKV